MSSCIVLTRSAEDNHELEKELMQNGFTVLQSPCIKINYQDALPHEEQDFFSHLRKTNLKPLFFVPSRYAWIGFRAWFKKKNHAQDFFSGAQFTAVGKKSAQVMQNENFAVSHVRDYAHDLSLLIAQNFSAQEFFIVKPRGNLSRSTGEDILRAAGFSLLSLTMYTNEEIFPLPLIQTSCPQPQAIVFYSPSAVRRFFNSNPSCYFQKIPQPTFFSLGSTTADELHNIGFSSLLPADMSLATICSLIKNTCRANSKNKNLP